jgi:NAD(P)H-nitrite reductase large subunit
MAAERYDYLIIGNSAGAIGCIEGIRAKDRKGTIAVVSDEKHRPYGRPLITHLLDGEVALEQMAYRPRDYYRKAKVTPLLGTRAEGIDARNRIVRLSGGGKLGFGKLLLATGGKPIVPPMPGLACDGVHTMVTLDDSLAVKKRLPGVRNAVVLGGGLIGTKTAEAISHVVGKVTIVELADRMLGLVTDPVASNMIRSAFRHNGVEVITGATIGEIRGDGTKRNGVREVALSNGLVLPCDLLVVAIGVSPRTELAQGAGIRAERGFVVDQRMATTRAGVYACGDAACAWDFVLGGMRLLPLWPNAYVGGRVAGLNMAGAATDYRWATNMNAAVFFRLPVVTAGMLAIPKGRDGKGYREIVREGGGAYAKLVLKDDLVRGMVMAGRVGRDAGVYLGLMRDQVPVAAFGDTLLTDRFSAASLPERLRERFRGPVQTLGEARP